MREREKASEGPVRLTLHPLLALALLLVLFLEFRDQALIHVPGLRRGALLFLLYTGEEGGTHVTRHDEPFLRFTGRRHSDLQKRSELLIQIYTLIEHGRLSVSTEVRYKPVCV